MTFLIKPYVAKVTGYEGQHHIFYAASRAKAVGKCWRALTIAEDITFKDALIRRRISVKRAPAPEKFGTKIWVCDLPAYFIEDAGGNQIRFVRPHADTILLSHKDDVEWADEQS